MSQVGSPAVAGASTGSTRHWLVAAGAACLMVAAMFVFLSPSILNPLLAESLGIGLSQVMIYNSLMAVSGVLAMSVLAPVLFRRIGLRAAVVVGGGWVAATIGAVAFVTGPAALYALGFATGLMFGVSSNMAASMLVNTWFEERRGTVMGAVFAISGVGGISAGLVLPAVVDAGGWRLGFAVTAGLIVLLVVVPGIFLIRSSPGDVGLLPYGATSAPAAAGEDVLDVPGVPAKVAFRTPQFAALALAIVLIASVQAVQQHFAPLMVERGVELALAGSLISLMALASIFTNVFVGTLNDRRGTLAAVTVALLGQALAMAGYLISVGFLPLALSTTVFAFGATLPTVLVPILVMQMFGLRDYAIILGPVMAMMPAGMSVGTPLWGMAFDLTGSYSLALGIAVVLTVTAALLLWWALRTAPALRARVARTAT